MAISGIGPYELGWPIAWSALRQDYTIDASGEKIAFIFRVPKSGNIDRVIFRTQTVTSSQTLRVSLQTLDGSGDPSGSYYGGSNYGTQTSPAATTTYEVTLGTAAAATVGDYVAVVIEFDSTAGNLVIAGGGTTLFPNGGYSDHYTASWSKSGRQGMASLRYDDGVYRNVSMVPAGSFSGATFNSGSTPDERGNKIVLDTDVQAFGMYGYIDADNASDLVLYDSGGTALETVAVSSVNRQGTATAWGYAPFAERTLTAGTYRVVLKPGASNVALSQLDVLNASQLSGISDIATLSLTTRTDGGSWTDTDTSLAFVGLLINGVETGGGGGGGAFPANLSGGIFQ